MPISTLAPPPLRSRLVDKTGLMTREFNNWLRGLTSTIDEAATVAVVPLVLSGQTTSLATTTVLANAAPGTYRLSYTVRLQRAATTSSSIAVSLTWVSSGALVSYTQPALTSNLLNDIQSGVTLALVDPGALISLTTTYASVGATTMVYEVQVVAEELA